MRSIMRINPVSDEAFFPEWTYFEGTMEMLVPHKESLCRGKINLLDLKEPLTWYLGMPTRVGTEQ